MVRKKKPPKGTPPQVTPKAVIRSPKEIFEFWDEESMRQAKPISLDVDRPARGDGNPKEE